MRIGMLGTGMVGTTLATKLADLGHDVKVGSRDPSRSFADAAAHGEVVFNATAGVASLDALRMAGDDNLAGKVLIDVANPLDASQGFPPTLAFCNTDSLGERIQREFPDAPEHRGDAGGLTPPRLDLASPGADRGTYCPRWRGDGGPSGRSSAPAYSRSDSRRTHSEPGAAATTRGATRA